MGLEVSFEGVHSAADLRQMVVNFKCAALRPTRELSSRSWDVQQRSVG